MYQRINYTRQIIRQRDSGDDRHTGEDMDLRLEEWGTEADGHLFLLVEGVRRRPNWDDRYIILEKQQQNCTHRDTEDSEKQHRRHYRWDCHVYFTVHLCRWIPGYYNWVFIRTFTEVCSFVIINLLITYFPAMGRQVLPITWIHKYVHVYRRT